MCAAEQASSLASLGKKQAMHLVGVPGYLTASTHTRKQLVRARAECAQQGGSAALAAVGQGVKVVPTLVSMYLIVETLTNGQEGQRLLV